MKLIDNDGGDDQDFVGGHAVMVLIMVVMTMILTKCQSI